MAFIFRILPGLSRLRHRPTIKQKLHHLYKVILPQIIVSVKHVLSLYILSSL